MSTSIIVACAIGNQSFELKAESLSVWLEAKALSERIEVTILAAPEEYQSLINTKIFAYLNGETITVDIPKSGKFHLRQTGFFFPHRP